MHSDSNEFQTTYTLHLAWSMEHKDMPKLPVDTPNHSNSQADVSAIDFELDVLYMGGSTVMGVPP